MGLPRIRLVFRFWECDNENQIGVRARQRALPAKVPLRRLGLHPP
jgi:hypothetical protein